MRHRRRPAAAGGGRSADPIRGPSEQLLDVVLTDRCCVVCHAVSASVHVATRRAWLGRSLALPLPFDKVEFAEQHFAEHRMAERRFVFSKIWRLINPNPASERSLASAACSVMITCSRTRTLFFSIKCSNSAWSAASTAP